MANSVPKFRVDKEVNPPVVWLMCSNCDVDIRTIKDDESIQVTRAYYCDDCDDGTIVLNMGTDNE